MVAQIVIPEVRELIDRRAWSELRLSLEGWPAAEVADLLSELPPREAILAFRVLPRRVSAEVFSYFTADQQEVMLLELREEETRRLLADLPPDDRTHILEELPGQVTQQLMNLLSPSDLAEARKLLGYPEGSIGRLMTPDYVAVRPEWTISRALEHVRRRGKISETINRIYVIDEDWKLIDDFELRRLILADPEQQIREIMDDNYVALSAFDDGEVAVRTIQRYDMVALPVVDSDGVLVGIVTVDDLLDVAEEEATEDFHRVGSVEPLRRSYWEATVYTLFRMRIGWLAGLVLVNLVSGGVLHIFEETLQSVIALAFFMPLIIATGGNAGTQSATIIIRAISTGDVDLSEWFQAVGREAAIGLLLGLAIGLLGFVLGIFRGGWELGLVVFLTLQCMLLVTNLMGMSLPFIFARFGIDPAVASGPLVTSIADIIGLLIYFSIATAILL
jgi:magnesium transporter